MKNKILNIVAFIALFIIGFMYLNKVFATRHYYNNTISDFKKLSKETNIDVIFYGSSRSYTAYNPLIFNSINKTISYNLGSDAFKLYFTDLLFLESNKYTKPKLVLLELYPASFYGIGADEDKGFQLRGLDFVSNFSIRKFKEVSKVYENNEFLNVYFPLIRNHMKWDGVDYLDLDRSKNIDTVENYYYNGFLGSRHILNDKIKLEYANFNRDDYVSQNSTLFFDSEKEKQLIDVVMLMRSRGAEVLIISSPDLRAKFDFGSFYTELIQICKELDVPFLNLNDHIKEIGLSLNDFKDYSHLNTYGSLKTSIYLAKFIQKNYQLPDRSSEKVWKESAIKYDLFKKEYNTKSRLFQNSPSQTMKEGISIKNIKIEKKYSYKFSIQFNIDNNIKLSEYKMAIHAYPAENNNVYLSQESKKRGLSFDIADLVLTDTTDFTLDFNTKIKEFKKIDFFLYNSKGFEGVIGNKISIYPNFY